MDNAQNGVRVGFDYYSSSEENQNPQSRVIFTNGCVNESTSKLEKTTVSSASSSSEMNRENKLERVKSDVKEGRWENEKLEMNREHRNHHQHHQQNVNKNHKRRAKTGKNRYLLKSYSFYNYTTILLVY